MNTTDLPNCCCKYVLEELQLIRKELQILHKSLVPLNKDKNFFDESKLSHNSTAAQSAANSIICLKTRQKNNSLITNTTTSTPSKKIKKAVKGISKLDPTNTNNDLNTEKLCNNPEVNFSFKIDTQNIQSEDELNRTPLLRKTNFAKHNFLENLFDSSKVVSPSPGAEAEKVVTKSKPQRRGRKRKI